MTAMTDMMGGFRKLALAHRAVDRRTSPAKRRGRKRGRRQRSTTSSSSRLVAPIALYPDDLLSQVLMAATYPLEVVEAARWSQDNPKLTGKALEDAMQKQEWDPSVKALTAVPETLQMMNDRLSWTQDLGDAFLAQQTEVLDAVQRLRARADTAGNLKSTPQQTVRGVNRPGQCVRRQRRSCDGV